MKEIPLTQGLVATVDDADFERVLAHKWSAENGEILCLSRPDQAMPTVEEYWQGGPGAAGCTWGGDRRHLPRARIGIWRKGMVEKPQNHPRLWAINY